MINLIQIFLVFRGHHYFDDSINFHRGGRGGGKQRETMEAISKSGGRGEGRRRKEEVPPLKFISSPLAEYQCCSFQTFLFRRRRLIDFCINSTHFFCTINGVIGSRDPRMIKTLFGDKLPWTSFDSPISSSPKDYLREGRGISIWTNGRKRVKCNIVTVMDLLFGLLYPTIFEIFLSPRLRRKNRFEN